MTKSHFIKISAIILIIVFLYLIPIVCTTIQFYGIKSMRAKSNLSYVDQTEVYLIGSRHTPISNYNQETLYQTLDRIEPHIVLLEWDSTFFSGNRLKWLYQIVLPKNWMYPDVNNLEMLAATKYSQRNEKIILAPFEWQGTKQAVDKLLGDTRTKLMRALLNMGSDTAYQILKQCAQLRSHSLELTTLEDFNNGENDSLMNHFTKLEYEVLPQLIINNDALKEYHASAREFRNYWPTRNQHMSENILSVIRKNPQKKIVILTGFRHRYFIKNYLIKKSENFKLLNFESETIELHSLK